MMPYHDMKKRCTFFASMTMLLLCMFILSSFSNVWAKESGKADGQQLSDIVEFTGITLYREGDGKQWEQVSTGDLLQKDTALFLAYTYTITDEEKIEKIQANTPYYLNISPHLVLPTLGDAGEVLKLTDSEGVEVTFGYLHSDGTNAWLMFTKSEDTASGYQTVVAEYGGLTSAHFYLECKRVGTPPANDIEESTENNCFVMKFENGEKLEFGYWELMPQYADAKVLKSGTRNGATKTITWAVDYVPMQNPSGTNGITADTAFELRDVIDTTSHTLQKDSLTINNVPVTVSDSRAEIQADAETYAFVEMDGKKATLVIGGKALQAGTAKQGETITPLRISYRTEIVDTLLLKPIETPKNGDPDTGNGITLLANEADSGVNIQNEVSLYAEINGTFTSMEIGASDTVNIPKLEWVKKEGDTKRQYDDTSIGSITTWTVTFNPNGFTFDAGSSLTLHDQLPAHSKLDGDTVNVKIGSSTAVLPVTKDEENNSFTVSGITTSGEPVTITYKTTVSEDAYNSGQDLGENTAWFTFTNDGSSYTTSKAKYPVGDGSGGLGISPLVKSNSGYDHATRSVTWTVTINPHKANFTKGIFVDDLKNVGGFEAHEHTNGLELVGDADDIEIKINDAAVTSNEDKVKVEYDAAERIIKVEVGEIERNKVTLTYKTKLCDPCLFANNVNNAGLTNKISTTDMIIGGTQVATKESPRVAESQVVFSVGMLKKNAPVYDYRTGEMTWTVEVNENNLPLTGICLTDVLPAGLRYVEDSIEISNNTKGNADTADEDGRQRLTIRLDDFNTKATITFRTKVDWGVMGFDGSAAEMEVSNTINIEGFADGVEFTESDTVSRTFVNHGLVKSDRMVDTDNEMIEYEVLINPYRLKLPKTPALVDTLDPRLQLDWDTLRLYKATLSGDSGNGTQKLMLYHKS